MFWKFLYPLIFLAIPLLENCAHSQQPSYFIMWEEYFDGVDIYDIHHDQFQNYWFATNQGVFCHDGFEFKQIHCPEMIGTSVFNLCEDSLGAIYFNNLNKQVFKVSKGVCQLFFEIPSKGADAHLSIFNGLITVSTPREFIALTPSGRIVQNLTFDTKIQYLGVPFQTQTGTIIRHASQTDSILEISGNNAEFRTIKIPQNIKIHILNFFRANGRTFAIGSKSKCLFEYDHQSHTLTLLMTVNSLKKKEVPRLYAINDEIWIAGTLKGITKIATLDTEETEKLFLDFFISNAHKDREGNILFSTFGQGVIVIPEQHFLRKAEVGFKTQITKLEVGDGDTLYFGTDEGGIHGFANQQFEIRRSGNKRIESLIKLNYSNILLSDINGITSYRAEELRNYNHGALKSAIELDTNTILLGMNVGLLRATVNDSGIITVSNIISRSRIYRLSHERSSKYSYAMTSKGVFLVLPSGEARSLLFKGKKIKATTLYSDDEHTYIATQTSEVLKYSKGKYVETIRPKFDGISLPITKLEMSDDHIFAYTRLGLFMLNKQWELEQAVGKSLGLSDNKISDFAIGQKQLFVAQGHTILAIDLDKLNLNSIVPDINWKSIYVNDKPIAFGQKSTHFDSDENHFKFEFISPSIRYHDDIKYQYTLSGTGSGWITLPQSVKEVDFKSLSPGNYTLKVRAKNNGRYSQTLSYSFVIKAPYYESWWFYTIIAFLVIMLFYLVYSYRLRQLKKLNFARLKSEIMKKELLDSKLKALRSQMNPHFIFNSLNAIQELVLKQDSENSYDYIVMFSELVRSTLNYSNQEYIPIDKEIEFLNVYLNLEKLRFKDSLSCEIIYDGPMDIEIPSLLIQPFIENALLHGLLHKEGVGKITVLFKLEEQLTCIIEDNGIGRQRSAEINERTKGEHSSFSLQAIQTRLKILEGEDRFKTGYSFEDLEERGKPVGTRVTIHLPYNKLY